MEDDANSAVLWNLFDDIFQNVLPNENIDIVVSNDLLVTGPQGSPRKDVFHREGQTYREA